jgi:hypothetical protein
VGTDIPIRNSYPYFLKRRSKAVRASSAFLGAGGPDAAVLFAGAYDPFDVTPSRATVTRGENNWHSFALSLTAIRAGIGFWHWKRVEGSKCVHCLQQCNSA